MLKYVVEENYMESQLYWVIISHFKLVIAYFDIFPVLFRYTEKCFYNHIQNLVQNALKTNRKIEQIICCSIALQNDRNEKYKLLTLTTNKSFIR